MSRRWFVIDTRVWEVVADDEAEAIELVEDSPDADPVCRTTVAEPVARPRPASASGPGLRVLG
jgi:hypothetical protein